MLSLETQEAALCSLSPTGKHHWMIPTLGARPVGICKWCEAERQFDNTAGDGHWDPKAEHSRVVYKNKKAGELSRFRPDIW